MMNEGALLVILVAAVHNVYVREKVLLLVRPFAVRV